LLDRRLRLLERVRLADAAHLANLARDVVLVLRQVLRERRHLRDEQPPEPAEHRNREGDGHDDGDDARQPPALQPLDDRGEHEGQQHRQRDRDEDVLGDAETEEGEGEDDHLQERLQAAERIAAARGHRDLWVHKPGQPAVDSRHHGHRRRVRREAPAPARPRGGRAIADVGTIFPNAEPSRPLARRPRHRRRPARHRVRPQRAREPRRGGRPARAGRHRRPDEPPPHRGGGGVHPRQLRRDHAAPRPPAPAARGTRARGGGAEGVGYILDSADGTTGFVGDAFLPRAEGVREAARVKHWITLGAERRPWAVALDDLLARGSETPPAAPAAVGGSMVYTAGTTGKPKGALRRVIDPGSVLPRLAALNCLAADQVHLVAGPLYHSAPGGFALYAQMVGGTVVVMRKFDPEDALRVIERHRCTTTFMAPTLLKRIVDLPADVRARHDVSSMRSLVIAAAPCPMRVKEQAVAMFGPALYEFYGSTELGVNTVLRPEDVLRKPGSCGRAAPGVELAILDDDGRRAAPGTPGELFVRRYEGVFDEYYGNPTATAQTSRGE